MLRRRARNPTQSLLSFRPHHPAQVVVTGFAIAITVVTLLLWLPVAREGDGAPTTFRQALFTATSAVCVTGLTVVDTEGHWSTFGELIILGGIQVGGFGIMTGASLLGLLVSRRLGLRTRLSTAAETKSFGLGDVRRVLAGVAITALVVESFTALVLFLRFWTGYDNSAGRAAYLGIFHGVSSFNNGGFALWSDSLVRFATDPWVCLPVAVAGILGGLGFPVLLELRRERRPVRWSLHTKMTLLTYGLLLVGGSAVITVLEWGNPATLGALDSPSKVMAGFFQGVMPRSVGFNTIDYSQMREPTWLVTDVLMFIGGGSASTAGGIKVTTFMLLFFAILSETRGDPSTDAFGRRIAEPVLRQALSVALVGVACVVTGTFSCCSSPGSTSTGCSSR
jgi:Trk-type K+ transport system membrane component